MGRFADYSSFCLTALVVTLVSLAYTLVGLGGGLIYPAIAVPTSSDNVTLAERRLSEEIVASSRCRKPPVAPRNSVLVNGLWHVVREPTTGTRILIFGAYLDDRRRSRDPERVLRILAVSAWRHNNATVFCQLWYPGLLYPVVTTTEARDTGRGCLLQGDRYQEMLYSCVLPASGGQGSDYPRNVSLVFDRCQNPAVMVPVTVATPRGRNVSRHAIGACVPVTYGHIDPSYLIEWIEFHRLLGVSQFNIYTSRLNPEASRVLNFYANSTNETVIVRPVAPPMEEWCTLCQKLTVIPALNDCLYRNMRRYRYILVLDFDEFLIPSRTQSLPTLIENLGGFGPNPPPSFMFRNAYFFLDYYNHTEDSFTSNPVELVTMHHVTRLPVSPPGYASKSLINPQKCIVLQNHYCMIRTSDVGVFWAADVHPSRALVHHYKRCHFSTAECQRLKRHVRDDPSALAFKDQLLPRVLLVFEALEL